jgi:hypothetical protein
MQQTFRTPAGASIGYTRRRGPYTVGYLMNGVRVGYYCPRLDVTYLPNGSRVGYGNLLGALILQAA